LPEWVDQLLPDLSSQSYPSDDEKMRLAVELSRKNVEASTGGPFGAAIFEATTGTVISVGVNRVVPLNNSTAHAEMMAFMLAQYRLRRFRLDSGEHDFVMATSAQPCAMCYGACAWAGIHRLIIGARRMDVESLTEFDEGPMPDDWIAKLLERGIRVTRDVLRVEACEVLALYKNKKGTHY
jgi:tRNA(Arg) A34 adenosine deaminase TadA